MYNIFAGKVQNARSDVEDIFYLLAHTSMLVWKYD